MNACVRAVVRTAAEAGQEVIGILRGYQGLLEEDFFVASDGKPHMTARSVSNLSPLGGTILRTSRSSEFQTEAGLKKAAAILRRNKIDALVPIGGDGTFHGAVALARYWDGRIIGCPGTIDNDLRGTDYTIGFATAVHTAVEAVDKLRDTAESHERMFLVEVMGRHSGYIALYTALAAGAEVVCIPETPTHIVRIIEKIKSLRARGKKSIIAIVAEGDEAGGAAGLVERFRAHGAPFDIRTVILGHVQRGGSPVPADRILATRLGAFAVRSILDGHSGKMAGQTRGELVLVPFPDTFGHNPVPPELIELLETMAT